MLQCDYSTGIMRAIREGENLYLEDRFSIQRACAKEVMRMKWSSLCLLLLPFGIVGLSSAQDWDKGENRIPNSDFEMDPNGAEPTGWTLEDGT
jgi:hypothetical protein